MNQINANVTGTPTDVPYVQLEGDDRHFPGVFDSPNRVIFAIDAAGPHGARLYWDGQNVRFLLPPSGSHEAADLGIPTLTYAPPTPAITIDEGRFRNHGQPWTWIGCTDFRLPHRLMEGEDIAPVLADRQGFTLLRSLAMKAPNTNPAWELNPRRPDYWDGVRRYFDAVGNAGFALEWTVFADNKSLMPDPSEQQDFWGRTVDLTRSYPFVLLELLNEVGHPTQAIDPQRFDRPSGVIASHGSGLTDEDVVQPLWAYAAYHSRRLEHGDDARGATNMSPYAYQEGFAKAVPYVSDENPKPPDYGCNPAYARLMGQHAACGWGGTFHSNEGIQSVVFPAEIKACAIAFCEALR